jgi:hypothetical protein
MAKRRTKKDKIIAQLRREVRTRVPTADLTTLKAEESDNLQVEAKQAKVTKSSSAAKESYSLFSYDPMLIRKDLLRTLVWASIAFLIEIGLYIMWR